MKWRYFKREDFSCKHCGENKIDDAFVTMLDALRHKVGFPLVVTSGYRCPAYNMKVSSTGPDGPHPTGKASDVLVSRQRAYVLVHEAMNMGFTGIGVQQKGANRYIHLDTLPNAEGQPRPTLWSY